MEIESTCQICQEGFTDLSGKAKLCTICCYEFLELMRFSGLF